MGTATFFEDIEFGGKNKVRDFVFEEESDPTTSVEKEFVPIPMIAFGNDQDSIPIIDQVAIPEQQDIVEQFPEVQTQQPQEPVHQEQVPLRRSTREKRNAIPDDYIVFLREHEESDGVMEDDPINFRQAIQGSNSEKWIEAMNEECTSMQDNKVWVFGNLSHF